MKKSEEKEGNGKEGNRERERQDVNKVYARYQKEHQHKPNSYALNKSLGCSSLISVSEQFKGILSGYG